MVARLALSRCYGRGDPSPWGNNVRSEIQSYIDQGIFPFPVRISPSFEEDPDRSIKRKKKPTVPWTNFRTRPAQESAMASWWWDNPHPLGVGIPTDPFVVVDIDTEDPLRTLSKLFERIGIEPPDTRVVRTARLGFHVYFLRNGENVRNSTSKLAPGVDVRAIGGYVVVPPTGGWERFAGDAIAPVPPELVLAIQEATKKRDERPAPEKPVFVRREVDPVDAAVGRLLQVPEGERNNTLNIEAFRLGSLHAVDDLPGTVDAVLHKLLAAALSIGLERAEAEATIRSGFQDGPKTLPARRLTDLGNAERLVDARRESLRFCWGTGWYQWSKTHWESIPVKAHPVSEYKAVMRSLAEQKVPAQVIEWARKSESESRVNAACRLAKTDRRIVVTVEDLDSNPELLATPSGVVDLRTGKIRDAEPTDLQTKITDVPVDFGKAKRFEKFLVEVFPDPEVLEHVRRYLGYSITGYSREQKIHLWYGSGANGKSLALRILLHVLGSYAQTAAHELLIEKSHATHTTDRARLRGSRLVTTVETGEGRRWDMSTVKQLTGEDKITARFLYVDNIEFSATWSIVVATNHKPRILGHDRADWRRVLVVPFERTFDPGDPDLFSKLVEEGPQILGWLCKGARDYLRDGLKVPQRILDEVDRYRKEQDVVGEFLEERTKEEKEGFVERKRLFEDYRHWCGDSEFQFKRQAFYRIVGERDGWISHKRSGARGWIGHSLISPVTQRRGK